MPSISHPNNLGFFNEDEHEYLEHEVTSACGSDNYVCILGDFNAQTAYPVGAVKSGPALFTYCTADDPDGRHSQMLTLVMWPEITVSPRRFS